jgi:hypothetical protein
MNIPETQATLFDEGKPPIFRNWKQLYIFVLVMHVIIVTLFYFLKISFS